MRGLLRAIKGVGLGVPVVAMLACGGAERREPEPAPTPAASVAPSAVPSMAPPTLPGRTVSPPPAQSPPPARTPPPPAATLPPLAKKPPVTTAPTPPPVHPPTVDTARVESLTSDAERALAEGKLREAGTFFGDALALDPDNARALKGKARVATTTLGLTRTLVPEIASSEGVEGRLKQMDGFDSVEESNVRRAARVPGRTELDTTTGHLKPGDAYTVSIYLRNQSTKKKKNIKVSNVNVHRIVNDKDSVITVAWTPIEVQPKERGLVATVTGTWEDDVSSWVLNVRLLSEGGDIYENELVWK